MPNALLAPFTQRQTWLLIAGNALPLLGVLGLNWDAATLIILYWLETAIAGFWLVLRLIVTPRDRLSVVQKWAGDNTAQLNGIGLGLFVLVHAGIFMAVHLFILGFVAPGAWSTHLTSPWDFAVNFILPTGLWLPLAGLFAVRGVVTIDQMRHGFPLGYAVAGFYARIVLLQFVLILGGMLALFTGSTALLVLLVIIKTLIEIYWDAAAALVLAAATQAREKA